MLQNIICFILVLPFIWGTMTTTFANDKMASDLSFNCSILSYDYLGKTIPEIKKLDRIIERNRLQSTGPSLWLPGPEILKASSKAIAKAEKEKNKYPAIEDMKKCFKEKSRDYSNSYCEAHSYDDVENVIAKIKKLDKIIDSHEKFINDYAYTTVPRGGKEWRTLETKERVVAKLETEKNEYPAIKAMEKCLDEKRKDAFNLYCETHSYDHVKEAITKAIKEKNESPTEDGILTAEDMKTCLNKKRIELEKQKLADDQSLLQTYQGRQVCADSNLTLERLKKIYVMTKYDIRIAPYTKKGSLVLVPGTDCYFKLNVDIKDTPIILENRSAVLKLSGFKTVVNQQRQKDVQEKIKDYEVEVNAGCERAPDARYCEDDKVELSMMKKENKTKYKELHAKVSLSPRLKKQPIFSEFVCSSGFIEKRNTKDLPIGILKRHLDNAFLTSILEECEAGPIVLGAESMLKETSDSPRKGKKDVPNSGGGTKKPHARVNEIGD